MIRNTPEYMLKDGSPRYGIRVGDGLEGALKTEAPAPAATPERGGDRAADDILAKAVSLDAWQLAIAQDYRIQRQWADQDDDLLVAFRAEHAQLDEIAVRTTNEILQGNMKWAVRALKSRVDASFAVKKRRGVALRGSVNLVKFLIRTSRLIVLWLMITGPTPEAVAGGLVLLFLLGRIGKMNQARLRLPLRPTWRWNGLTDHRRDITDAVLLALVIGAGHTVDPETEQVVGRGWKHLLFVAGKVEEIRRGPGTHPRAQP